MTSKCCIVDGEEEKPAGGMGGGMGGMGGMARMGEF
jgi:chaperonin GroEL